MKKVVLLIMMLCMALTGCQKTPDKSSVVSKADGLREDVIAEPLASGEKRTLDNPVHWKINDKRSNDRVTISADLELGTIETGNLPVIEMKNHELGQEELVKLVLYFSENNDLYVQQIYTKDIYQKVIDRIENKEGTYGDTTMWTSHQELKEALKTAIKLAPDIPAEPKKAEIKFQKIIDNPAFTAAQGWAGGKKDEQDSDAENYFSVDVGGERTAHIDAERYDSKLGNSSKFSWMQGADIVEAATIQKYKMQCKYQNDAGLDTSGYTEGYSALLSQYDACLDQPGIEEEEGKKQAEQVLQDLDITDMVCSSSEKILWFPKGAFPERDSLGFWSDHLWQGNLEEAEAGYQYIFSANIEGTPVKQVYGTISEKTIESYTPPFPVEEITITVTKGGIRSFDWQGMTEEVEQIAENTELLSFETIQNQLLDQIFYWYSQQGQPVNDTTLFNYQIISTELEYTYIPAYKEPKNAWLVPVWVFTVKESAGEVETVQNLSFVLNALDGGVVGRTD